MRSGWDDRTTRRRRSSGPNLNFAVRVAIGKDPQPLVQKRGLLRELQLSDHFRRQQLECFVRSAVVREQHDLAEAEVTLHNGAGETELLLLQAQPIDEHVVTHGPFVMNSPAEIQQAFDDYRRTGFGGWPWPTDDPVFPRTEGRHARHADGRLERAG